MVHLPFRLYVVRGQRFRVTVQGFRVQGSRLFGSDSDSI